MQRNKQTNKKYVFQTKTKSIIRIRVKIIEIIEFSNKDMRTKAFIKRFYIFKKVEEKTNMMMNDI